MVLSPKAQTQLSIALIIIVIILVTIRMFQQPLADAGGETSHNDQGVSGNGDTVEYVTSTPTSTATATVVPPTPTEMPTATQQPTLAPVPTSEAHASGSRPTSQWERLTREQALEKWGGLVAQYDWPFDEAFAVMFCESRGDHLVRSSTGCVGLWQICTSSGQNEQYTDPGLNAAAAYSKYLDGVARGNPWYHWNNFGSCGHFS